MGQDEGERRRSRAPLRVRALRAFRRMHSALAIPLLVLVVVSAITGMALAWKKNVDVLQPPTRSGQAADLGDWRPLPRLAATARAALAAEIGDGDPAALTPDRLDVRPGDGIVKVLFPGAWEVQLDGATAEVLSVARRHADWIETLHDGSLISDGFKLVAMNALGLGLLALSVTGFWVWYGPRRIRGDRRTGGSRGSGRPERGGAEAPVEAAEVGAGRG
ncbi:MAG: PepSY domain-containing protein [Candidatus Longimicrobiales bacterium M2_2A_002]